MLIGAGQGMQLMAHGDGVSTADTPTPTLPMQAAPASLHAGVMPHVAGPPWRTQLPPAWTVVAAGGPVDGCFRAQGGHPNIRGETPASLRLRLVLLAGMLWEGSLPADGKIQILTLAS